MSEEAPEGEKALTLYEIIGCAPTATQEEIKRNYRIKARQLHPDHNQDDPAATEKFQQLAEAYEILKDPLKRENYDRFGLAGEEPQTQDEMDLFNMMTQIIGLGKSRGEPKGDKVPPTLRLIFVPMKIAYLGGTITKKFKLHSICPLCNGTGTNTGEEFPICETCHGAGSLLPGGLHFLFPCYDCNKVGYMTPPEKICKKCNGHKVIQIKKNIEVPIEMGINDQDPVIMKNMGDEFPKKVPADLYLLVSLTKTGDFIRDGDDLFMERTVSKDEMEKGVQFKIDHVDGRELSVYSTPNQPLDMNRYYMIQGEGFPCKGNVQFKGNLYIKFYPPQGVFTLAGAEIRNFFLSKIGKKKQHEGILLQFMPAEEQAALEERIRAMEEEQLEMERQAYEDMMRSAEDQVVAAQSAANGDFQQADETPQAAQEPDNPPDPKAVTQE